MVQQAGGHSNLLGIDTIADNKGDKLVGLDEDDEKTLKRSLLVVLPLACMERRSFEPQFKSIEFAGRAFVATRRCPASYLVLSELEQHTLKRHRLSLDCS